VSSPILLKKRIDIRVENRHFVAMEASALAVLVVSAVVILAFAAGWLIGIRQGSKEARNILRERKGKEQLAKEKLERNPMYKVEPDPEKEQVKFDKFDPKVDQPTGEKSP
jgi:hypothetical protein